MVFNELRTEARISMLYLLSSEYLYEVVYHLYLSLKCVIYFGGDGIKG